MWTLPGFEATPLTLAEAGRNHFVAISKPGSLCSPLILSPSFKNNLPSAPRRGDIVQADIISSTPDLLISDQIAGCLPLTPPTDASDGDLSNNPITSETTLVSADAIPSNYPLRTPPLTDDINYRLRFSPFDMLGIAADGPDHLALNTSTLSSIQIGDKPFSSDVGSTRHEAQPCLSHQQVEQLVSNGANHEASVKTKCLDLPFRPDVAILTPPPDDTATLDWLSSLSIVTDSGDQSSSVSTPQALPGHDDLAETSSPTAPALTKVTENGTEDEQGWVDTAFLAIVSCMDTASSQGNSLRVLSHALPSPSIPGHAYPIIIDSIRTQLSANRLLWINLLHAVPGRFNLADLPRSPPTTPGLPLGGDDYFSTKIFDSAVSAVDYENDSTLNITGPQPLVPPASVNLSIVERYIPPASANEFTDLFNPKGASLLVDRLVELSPGNGSLLFIYPTRKGAQAFMSHYLCPILDPLLRSMVVVNGFSADLSSSIGCMSAVDKLYDFETMSQRAKWLCREMNGTSRSALDRLHGVQGAFSVVHSAKHEVALDRSIWSSWWVKQEKPRVRAAVSKYFRLAKRMPADTEIMPTSLIQEVLDGVANKPCKSVPSKSIEIGVFVFKRER